MKMLIRPWEHQSKAIARSTDLDNYALFFEQGTGKTLTCVNMMRVKYTKHRRLLRTLILCPQIVIPNWKKEIVENSVISPDLIIPIQGDQVKRIAEIKKFGHNPFIAITNYESMTMEELHQAIQDWGVELLVCDESHKLKNIKAKRTKAVIRIADKALHTFLLTGTPILNSLEDIFAQFRVLDKGKSFGTNYWIFRKKYFKDKNSSMPKHKHFPDWRPRKAAESNIAREMNKVSSAIRKKDCLDLPPLVVVPIEYEMSPTLRKHYDEMERFFITYVNDDACVASLALTKALRLMQMTSGIIKTEKGDIVFYDDRAKVLKEKLEDLVPHHKVLIWAVHKPDYKAIRKVCDELKVEYVEVNGEVSPSQKIKSVESFNNDPKIRVLIGHPGSGGIGVNLVSSDVAIFYSRGFSLEQDLQAEARNHRKGSEKFKKITRYDIICKNTIDEQVLAALKTKERISLSVLKNIAKDLEK